MTKQVLFYKNKFIFCKRQKSYSKRIDSSRIKLKMHQILKKMNNNTFIFNDAYIKNKKIFYQKVLTITFENVTIYLVSLLDKQTIKEEENEK